jgi:hypothetical protein
MIIAPILFIYMLLNKNNIIINSNSNNNNNNNKCIYFKFLSKIISYKYTNIGIIYSSFFIRVRK